MPPPLPVDFKEAVSFWKNKMQEPRQTDEDKWNYIHRLSSTLDRFLKLTDEQRIVIASGVIDDHIPYRGDTFDFYMLVAAQSALLREQGKEAYLKHWAPKVQKYGKNATRQR